MRVVGDDSASGAGLPNEAAVLDALTFAYSAFHRLREAEGIGKADEVVGGEHLCLVVDAIGKILETEVLCGSDNCFDALEWAV